MLNDSIIDQLLNPSHSIFPNASTHLLPTLTHNTAIQKVDLKSCSVTSSVSGILTRSAKATKYLQWLLS